MNGLSLPNDGYVCQTADEDGKVTDIAHGVVTVEYKSGKLGKYDIGTDILRVLVKQLNMISLPSYLKETLSRKEALLYNKGYLNRINWFPVKYPGIPNAR